jgi:hypothetical protein
MAAEALARARLLRFNTDRSIRLDQQLGQILPIVEHLID